LLRPIFSSLSWSNQLFVANMDALYFKVDHLKLLWSEYRIANENVDRDYSDHSEWARKKLQ
ncbi:10231_t:CDS:1, partial [Scutellospora calospora]